MSTADLLCTENRAPERSLTKSFIVVRISWMAA